MNMENFSKEYKKGKEKKKYQTGSCKMTTYQMAKSNRGAKENKIREKKKTLGKDNEIFLHAKNKILTGHFK